MRGYSRSARTGSGATPSRPPSRSRPSSRPTPASPAWRSGLSRPAGRRGNLALRRPRLCPARLRPRDSPRPHHPRPDHRREGRHAEVDEPKDQIVEAEQALYQLGEQGKIDKGFQTFRRAVIDAVKVANAAYEREGGLAGISTRACGPRQAPRRPTVRPADPRRPSVDGQASLATNIAFNIARPSRKARSPTAARAPSRAAWSASTASKCRPSSSPPGPLRGEPRPQPWNPPRRHDRGGDATLHPGRRATSRTARSSSTTRRRCRSPPSPPAPAG